jgi:RNA recognition motif-containing protein
MHLQVKQWRLIIRNLPFSVDEPELMKYVGKAAVVWDASIPKDETGKKKGFGFVSFTCRAHAAKAMDYVNGKVCSLLLLISSNAGSAGYSRENRKLSQLVQASS